VITLFFTCRHGVTATATLSFLVIQPMRALLRDHLFRSRSPAPTLLLRLQACEFSSSHSSFSSSSSSTSAPNHSRDVRVSVWWDFQSCAVPDDVEASKVAPAIEKAVRANGIKGPLHITAFGNPHLLPKPNQEALASSGIQVIHIPGGLFFSPSSLKIVEM